MGLQNGAYDDVLEGSYVSLRITVGTTQIEAKVGASTLAYRELVTIYNDSSSTVYYGPTGVASGNVAAKGIPIEKQTSVTISARQPVYLIAASANNAVIVQEFA